MTMRDYTTWEFEGDLYSTTLGYMAPLRTDYARHHRHIENGLQLRSCLRAGAYAWPGGYALYYITDDGGALCPDCVKAELVNVIWSIRNECSDGWRVIAMDSTESCDESVTCDHCNKEI